MDNILRTEVERQIFGQAYGPATGGTTGIYQAVFGREQVGRTYGMDGLGARYTYCAPEAIVKDEPTEEYETDA